MAGEQGTPAPATTPAPTLVESLLPGILGRAKVVVSPYPFATQDDDSLRITVVNSLPGVTVEVHGRLVTRAGDATPFRYVLAPTSNRLATSQDFRLSGGFVSNLSAFAANGSPLIGQTFVIVQIVRGAGLASFLLGTLLSAYVTATQPIGWPGTPIQSSIEGGGYPRHIVGSDPNPGFEVSEVVPTGARWRLHHFSVLIALSAAAPVRRPHLWLLFPNLSYWFSQSPFDLAASTTRDLMWAEGTQCIGNTDPRYVNMPLPSGMTMLAGSQLVTITDGLDAGDNYNAPTYTVDEWLEAL